MLPEFTLCRYCQRVKLNEDGTTKRINCARAQQLYMYTSQNPDFVVEVHKCEIHIPLENEAAKAFLEQVKEDILEGVGDMVYGKKEESSE